MNGALLHTLQIQMQMHFQRFLSNYILLYLLGIRVLFHNDSEWGGELRQNRADSNMRSHRKPLTSIPRTSVCYLKAAQLRRNTLPGTARRRRQPWYLIGLLCPFRVCEPCQPTRSWGAVGERLLSLNTHATPLSKRSTTRVRGSP